MLLVAIVGIAACIITPIVFKVMDRKHNERINKIGRK
jgi:hypothetical protein